MSKSVGNAVVRNTVKRRFRVLAHRFEGSLPQSCDVVLRARPTAARTPFANLEVQVDEIFQRIGTSNDVKQQSPNKYAVHADVAS